MTSKQAATAAAKTVSEGTPEAPPYTALPLEASEKGRFRRLVKQLADLSAQIKNLETLKHTVQTDLGAVMVRQSYKSVMMDTYKVTLVESQKPTLKKELLLEQGVTMSQIEKATKYTPVLYVQVTDTQKEK